MNCEHILDKSKFNTLYIYVYITNYITALWGNMYIPIYIYYNTYIYCIDYKISYGRLLGPKSQLKSLNPYKTQRF